MDTSELERQHRKIATLADALEAAIASDTPVPVAAIRWSLARVLMAHLALEDRWLYPALAASPAPATSRTACAYQAEMGGLAERFRDYLTDWPEIRIPAEWPRFQTETRALLDLLARRIDREDRILYPLARALPGTPSTPRHRAAG